MWLASRNGLFTCFCIFLAKEFRIQQNEKMNQKSQRKDFEESEKS